MSCEQRPTLKEKLQYYRDVLDEKVEFCGGHQVTSEQGVAIITEISPEVQKESAIKEAREKLGQR